MITIKEIADIVGGSVLGNGKTIISGLASAKFAGKNDLTFAADTAQLKAAVESEAPCVLTALDGANLTKTILKVKDLKAALTILYNAMTRMRPPAAGSTHPAAIVDRTADIGKNVSIGPHAVIGANTKIGDNVIIGANCTIGARVVMGENTRIYPNTCLYDGVIIGRRVIIHSGTIIGADGFGYVKTNGEILKVPQLGTVIIEDNVEIGANTCIDRGAFDDTVISEGTKLDNLVQIAHNVKLGKNVLIAAQTGISGSVTVGDDAMMGGQAGIVDHVRIGKNVKIAAQAGVIGNVGDGKECLGYPAREAKEMIKMIAFSWWLYGNADKIRKAIKGIAPIKKGQGEGK